MLGASRGPHLPQPSCYSHLLHLSSLSSCMGAPSSLIPPCNPEVRVKEEPWKVHDQALKRGLIGDNKKVSKDDEDSVENFLKRTYLDKILVIAVIFIIALTVLITVVDTNIPDIHTAIWYIVVSMTGTGYGDIVPATTTGRIIGMIAMVGGILIFSTITAVISSIYVTRINTDNHDDLDSKLKDLTCEMEKLNKKIDELKKE